MTTRGESPEVELLHRAFDALSVGDFGVLERTLAEDARWRTVEEGNTNCAGRHTIVEIMSRNLRGRLRGSIEETTQTGSRMIVAFRPQRPADTPGRPLDDGIAYMVVTIEQGKITELKGCVDRAAAEEYVQTGETPPVPGSVGVQPPETVVEPAERRVSRLVPFVKVADVERSVAFYHHLGFTPTSIYRWHELLVWAALDSEGPEIMFQHSDAPEPGRQGILFYLYSHDLGALREQLLAAGVEAGEIEDGTPGPRREMRVIDPDGYELMIAQIE
jgi:ketosteroid isomerase-like protein/catechol 2,3-dioxygenase-like lactoylglutathione lyase family enzyme